MKKIFVLCLIIGLFSLTPSTQGDGGGWGQAFITGYFVEADPLSPIQINGDWPCQFDEKRVSFQKIVSEETLWLELICLKKNRGRVEYFIPIERTENNFLFYISN